MLGGDIEKQEKVDSKLANNKKTIYSQLINLIDTQNIIDKTQILERLEENQLSDANLIDKNMFLKKKTRVNTKNKYTHFLILNLFGI